MKELLSKFWNNKKLRDLVILTILIITLIISLVSILTPQKPNKSVKLLICSECGEYQTQSFTDLNDMVCSKCKKKGKMQYCYKCSRCDFEFGVTPLTKKELEGKSKNERIKANIYNKQCPHCKSCETYPLFDNEKVKNSLKQSKQKK